jgi:hypothetical protein
MAARFQSSATIEATIHTSKLPGCLLLSGSERNHRARSYGKRVHVGVLLLLAMFKYKIVLLETLDPVGYLSCQVLETKE